MTVERVHIPLEDMEGKWDDVCHACRTLNLKGLRQYGYLEDLVRRMDCPVCKLILTLFPRDIIECTTSLKYFVSLEVVPIQKQSLDFIKPLSQGRLSAVACDRYEYKVWLGQKVYGRLSLRPSASSFPAPTLNYREIGTWIRNCVDNHPCSDRRMAAAERGSFNTYFIDVEYDCLASRPIGDTRFIALSYVRGNVSVFEARSHNIEELQKTGALSDNSKNSINTLFKNAITFTRSLGEKYLWIDALCIIQDEGPHKGEMISRMDLIYNRALLTLVALSGHNANCSLPGVRSGTRQAVKRNLKLKWKKSSSTDVEPPLRFSVASSDFPDSVMNSVYETRGWTFQERVLSVRLLLFTNHQVVFACPSRGRASADVAFPRSDVSMPKKHNLPVNHFFPGWQHDAIVTPSHNHLYSMYAMMVKQYSRRQLTYESDALAAFSGTLSMLAARFGVEFDFGLLTRHFGAALNWQNHSENQRRNKHFPSWSWIGWSGHIEYDAALQRDWLNLPSESQTHTLFQPSTKLSLDKDVSSPNFGCLYVYSKTVSLAALWIAGRSKMRCIHKLWTEKKLSIRDGDMVSSGLIWNTWPDKKAPWDHHADELPFVKSHRLAAFEFVEVTRLAVPNSSGQSSKFATRFASQKQSASRDYTVRGVNVLLVKWDSCRQYAERITTGVIDVEDWNELASEEVKTIAIK